MGSDVIICLKILFELNLHKEYSNLVNSVSFKSLVSKRKVDADVTESMKFIKYSKEAW